MVRKPSEMRSEIRPNMRGGRGDVTVRHLFQPEEFGGKVRLCAQLSLPAGASIGLHAHADEDEVYLVTRGSGMLDEGGRETRVQAGDAMLTGKGASHAIRNDGPEPLEIVAFIVTY
jgi:mannose-6-phosphate isomerase-like protein (cupin superfamily)